MSERNGVSLPADWKRLPISQLTVRTKQRDPRRTPTARFRYVDVSSVSNSSFRISETAELIGANAPSRARKEIQTDDVLFATVRPTLKRVALVPAELNGQIASTGFIVLRADCSRVLPRYLYSRLLTDDFINRMGELERGASYPAVRDSDVLNEPIPVPRLSEQQKIAAVLGLVQRAIEQQERLLALTVELKKALLQHLFTYGLRNEPQKQTEVGLIPQSWKVVPLGSLMSEDPKNGLYKHSSNYGAGTLILRINDFSNDGDIVVSATNQAQLTEQEQQLYCLSKDDIVVNRVNSLSHLGKTAIVGELRDVMVFESNMMRFRADSERVLPYFLFRWMNGPLCKAQIIASAKRAVAQSSINQGNLKAIIMPLPSLEEQAGIVLYLQEVESKLSLYRRKRATLEALFRTLLHELMTAKIRLDSLDLNILPQQLPSEPHAITTAKS